MLQEHLSNFINGCHSNLTNDKNDEIGIAKAYLADRQISNESIAVHQIGYCYEGAEIPDEIGFGSVDKVGAVREQPVRPKKHIVPVAELKEPLLQSQRLDSVGEV